MSPSSPRTSSADAVEGHEFAGWEPAEPLSDDDRLKRERIYEARAEHIESVGLYDGETWP